MLETRQTSHTLQQLEELIARAASVEIKIDLLNNLAWQLRLLDAERAQALSLEALDLAKARNLNYGLPNEQGIANSLITLAFIDGEAGRLDSSLARALEALALFKDQPRSAALIDVWYTLGWAYYYSSDYPAALEFGLKSLNLSRELKLKEKEAWCLDLVASTYKDPAQSVQIYKDANAIFEELRNLEGQTRILNNWAYTLSKS